MRAIVGVRGGLDWYALWHDIRHEWNACVWGCTKQAGVKVGDAWNDIGKLVTDIANLPNNCWLKRAPAWTTGRVSE